MTIGERIKKLRKEKHLTQAQLGEILGVEKSAVAKWENGRTKNLKRDTLQAMSLIDGFVKRIYLFDLDDKDQMNMVIEYSPTGNDDDAMDYREIVGVREEHHRLHLMLHKRTLLKTGSSVIVEYLLNKKK